MSPSISMGWRTMLERPAFRRETLSRSLGIFTSFSEVLCSLFDLSLEPNIETFDFTVAKPRDGGNDGEDQRKANGVCRPAGGVHPTGVEGKPAALLQNTEDY